MVFFLQNSKFFEKLISLLLRKGKKEKIENKVLKTFRKINFFIFLENIFFLRLPFKLFSKKFRSGRHSFVYRNIFIILKKEKQYWKAIFYFYLTFKEEFNVETTGLERKLTSFLENFILQKNFKASKFKFTKKKEALFIKSLKHYRWG